MRKFNIVFAALTLLILVACNGSNSIPPDTITKANSGDSSAQFLLGMAFDTGTNGMRQDYVEAAKWYKKSAEQNNAKAQNSLGSLYQFGLGVKLDYTEAARWYQKAMNQGDVSAITNLGYLYDMGLGVPKDKFTATSLYKKAAEFGDPSAMLNLGISYSNGGGIEKNSVQAFKWLDCARYYTQTSNNMKIKWAVRGALDELTKTMTPAQIAEGKRLPCMVSKNFKG